MGVGDKIWEALDPLLDPGILGVEDVDPILGNPDAVLVDVVVAVPPDVLPLVDHQRGETQARAGLQFPVKFLLRLKRMFFETCSATTAPESPAPTITRSYSSFNPWRPLGSSLSVYNVTTTHLSCLCFYIWSRLCTCKHAFAQVFGMFRKQLPKRMKTK